MWLNSRSKVGKRKAVEELQRDEGSLSARSSGKAPRENCGLFTFAAPSEEEDYTVDIVAVHGLGGDWEATWTDDSNGQLWLRDFLPSQIPPARIMSYGYNSNTIFTSAVTGITVEAAMLLDRLDQERESEEQKTKPIIFVAHSLGGIVVKKALILAHERSKFYAGLLACVKGCLFLGVPHRGADIAYWGKFAADLLNIPQLGFGGNTNFLNALKTNSPTLADISQQFVERSSQLEIRTFFETEKVLNQLIVSEDSARLNIVNELTVGLANANHINMCKFAYATSQKYAPVWRALKRLIDSAVPVRVPSPVTPTPVSLSEKETECLQRLYTSNYRSFMNRTPEWEPGTCQWFLEHQRYRDWRQEKTSSLLWVSGDPGCGKSVLARFLVHELQSEESQSILPGTVCYFFFKDDNEKQKSASSAICALLHQFFESNPATIKHATREYNLKGPKMIDELDTLWEVLVAASTAPESGNIICVIDGLDECEEAARALLMDLLIRFYKRRPTSHSKEALLKMIITSRPYSSIERQFCILPTIRLRVEDETEALSADIEVVVNSSIEKLGELWDLPNRVRDQLRDKLLRNADRTFLWVSLILEMLFSTPKPSESEFDGILSTLPPDLDATFEKILRQSSDINEARRILHMVVAATRPLTLKEMNVAIAIRHGHRSMEDLQPYLVLDPQATLKALCGLFLRVIDSKIYLVHLSAKEFLINDSRISNGHSGIWKHSLPLSESGYVIGEACVLYLSFEVYGSHAQGLDNQGSINQSVAAHCFLDYAANNWTFHIRAAGSRIESPLIKLMRDLCVPGSKRLLTWLEVSHAPWRPPRLYDDSTELMVASHLNLEVLVATLLEAVADVNAQEKDGWTALREAGFRGDETIVPQLPAFGVNFHAQSKVGLTSLCAAASGGSEATASKVLEAGADIDAQDEYGESALHIAASRGFEGVVSKLLAAGAKVHAVDLAGRTALHVAARFGFNDTVSMLLAAGAKAHAVDSAERTALHLAASHGFKHTVSVLLEAGAKVNAVDSLGRTALHVAARFGFNDTVSMLLAAGAKVDAVDSAGRTALHVAASTDIEHRVSVLLAAGANVNAVDSAGTTALHVAASFGCEHTVSALLAAGAKAHAVDSAGTTALHEAASNGHVSIVELLLQHGAFNNARNNRGLMPLHVAAEGSKVEVLDLLLTEGVDFGIESIDWGPVLVEAAVCGLGNMVQQLLCKGVDISACNEKKQTALHKAVLKKREKMVEMLLENGILVDSEDMYGWTALHYAMQDPEESIIRLLLRHGANVFIRSVLGKTPLQVAETCGHEFIVRLLKSHIEGLDEEQRTNFETEASVRFGYTEFTSDISEWSTESDPESESEQSTAS